MYSLKVGSLQDAKVVLTAFLIITAVTNTCLCVCVCVCARAQSCPTLCDPTDWSKNAGVGCYFLLQGIFLTQG